MMEKDLELYIPRKLVLRHEYPDGRVSTLCVWEDGEWKVEIFASAAHALKFAEENQMEVQRASSNG
jgi:hypothetical protein